MFDWEWKSGGMEKVSLYKFTHILLLKNNAQLKQKNWQNKSNHPNLLKKKKSCLVKQKRKKKKEKQNNYHAHNLGNQKKKEKRKKKWQHPGKQKKKRRKKKKEKEKEKEKKRQGAQESRHARHKKRVGWSLCASEHEHFYQSRDFESPPSFLPIENIFVGLGRKYPGPTNFFSSPPSNQIPTKNVFSPIFSYFLSILPKIHPTKHTNEPQKDCPSMLGITYQRIAHNYFGKE